MIPNRMFKKIPENLDRLWHGESIQTSLKQIVDYYPEAIQIFATLNVYRVDQLLLAQCRGYNPEERLEEGYWIAYPNLGPGDKFSQMTKEDILEFLKKNNYPLADQYILPLPEVDPQ